jgi:predicted nucleotidyltransferase
VRLNRTDRIAGLPAEAARELMRQFRTPRPESGISVWIESGGRADAEIAQALAAAGWLKVNVEDLDGETWWETTTKGNALAQASFGRPITRATAQRHLVAVVDRARAFNSDDTHLIEIAELLVFGSYLDPNAKTLGDLDVAVVFRSRIPERAAPDEHTEMLLAYASASGRRFDTFIDRLFWPRQEAMLILRNRSAVINITPEDVRSLTDRWEIVHRADGQTCSPD